MSFELSKGVLPTELFLVWTVSYRLEFSSSVLALFTLKELNLVERQGIYYSFLETVPSWWLWTDCGNTEASAKLTTVWLLDEYLIADDVLRGKLPAIAALFGGDLYV